MYSVPGYGPKWIDGLVWIVGGESRNLATYRQDEGASRPTEKLEGCHWVPKVVYGDIEDELVDELPDETREDEKEELNREVEEGHG